MTHIFYILQTSLPKVSAFRKEESGCHFKWRTRMWNSEIEYQAVTRSQWKPGADLIMFPWECKLGFPSSQFQRMWTSGCHFLQWRHQIFFFFFFVGGIEGAKYVSERVKIKKIVGNGWFLPLISSTWGKVGGRASDEGGGGANAFHAPSPLMPPLITLLIKQ